MSIQSQFRVTDLDVLDVSASATGSEKPHVSWFVGYAPERESELGARVVMGTLHAVGRTSRGDIRVAALLLDDPEREYNEAEMAAALTESDAIETLYDFARVSLRSVLAIVDTDIVIPVKSPDAEIDELVRADEEEPNEEEPDGASP